MGQTGHPTSESIVVFTLDGQKFGLDISTVQRALRAVAITPLPNAPDTVIGLVNMRGTVIPVFDLRRRLGLPQREVRSSDHLIVADAGKRTVGLLVDAVDDVATFDGKTTGREILPQFESGAGIEGVARLDGGMIYIYDLARFLSPEEEASLDAALS